MLLPRFRLALALGGALALNSALTRSLHAQAEGAGGGGPGVVDVRFRVLMLDARGNFPVEAFTILVLSERGDSTFARTDATGGARVSLPPGIYRVARHEGVEFDGVRWVWDLPLAIRDGLDLIDLSQRNASRHGPALSRPGTTPVVVSAVRMSRLAASARKPTAAERIARVEGGLLPAVMVREGSSRTMTIAERMAHYRVPGVSIAVIEDFQIHWAKGYGVKRTIGAGGGGRSASIDTTTLFQAASISKPVTAMAALRLVQEGKLPLDEDVNLKLTSWKLPAAPDPAWRKVTLRGILSHSAGLTVHGFRGYAWGEPVPTLREVLDGVKPANSSPIRVDVAPGTVRRYSGGGFTVLQQLLEDVTGEPFAAFMREEVLRELRMSRSTFDQPITIPVAFTTATGHRANGLQVAGRWHTYPEMAAAGLWTTPSDLARFTIDILRSAHGDAGRRLSPEMTRQMLTTQPHGSGLGFQLGGSAEPASFSHNGANEGFRATLIAFTQTGQGAIVMTNSDNGGALASEIIRGLAREYGWPATQPKERVLVSVDPRLLTQFVGAYRLESGPLVTVTRELDRLVIQAPGESPTPVVPSSDSSYYFPGDGTEFTFLRDERGGVSTLVIVPSGRRLVAQRVR